MNNHNTYAYFYVNGFKCSPEEITSTLGFEPTESWTKGDKWNTDNTRERKESSWRFKTIKSDKDYYSNIHFNYLLKTLEKHKGNIANLPNNIEIGITYVATCYYPNIAVILDNDLLKKIVALGISLNYDIYSLSPEE